MVWFLLSISSALVNSLIQVLSKRFVVAQNYSKLMIAAFMSGTASLILFSVSFLIGWPVIKSGFWLAVLVTGSLNFIAFPLLLKAYQEGQFSSVYSMLLLTPVFSLLTSFIIFGEVPSVGGLLGVVLIVSGLYLIIQKNKEDKLILPEKWKANALAGSVAFIWSISINFDKKATLAADPFLSAAVALAFVFIFSVCYLYFSNPPGLKQINLNTDKGIYYLIGGGVLMAVGNILHNSALSLGLVSYTIAIKRTGILFGILWGYLFFREEDIKQKLLGSIVAIVGLGIILYFH